MHLAEDSHTFIWHKLLEHVSSYFILLKVYVHVFLYDQYYEKEKKIIKYLIEHYTTKNNFKMKRSKKDDRGSSSF